MEIGKSFESVRDFTFEMIAAGKVAVAQVIERIDTNICNRINGPEDES